MQSGLPPVVGESPAVLLLGSFPSETSLRVGEYYANRRNQMWRLLGALFGARPELAYQERIEILKQRRVALWDVLHACERIGSLDAAIDRRTAVANDVPDFLRRYPSIKVIGLNGGTAKEVFEQKMEFLRQGSLRIVTLPSSSGAHAAMPLADKVKAWSVLTDFAV